MGIRGPTIYFFILNAIDLIELIDWIDWIDGIDGIDGIYELGGANYL
jgi:hypothetical protein